MDLLGDMALFIAIARAKNFSAAAKATAVPLSSLSRRISSMESHALNESVLHLNTCITRFASVHSSRGSGLDRLGP